MAVMCPEKPREFDERSHEGEIFEALSRLPDSYYVFHSFSIVNVVNGELHESETDFVIYNREKGILCLEAKAGAVRYENGTWFYGSGLEMKHGGPFNQAQKNKYDLMNYIKLMGHEWVQDKCKFLHGVVFPSVGKEHLVGMNVPSESDMSILLTKDSFDNIEAEISRIFDIELSGRCKKTLLSEKESDIILNRILAPKFELVSIAQLEKDNYKQQFKRLLKEQTALLNYLDEQDNAVISGMAGTGKTVMAVEKAKRHAYKQERVLFLCYNRFLKDHLQKEYPNEYIDYYTIDGFACKICMSKTPDYQELKRILEELYIEQNFPYQHIVIDEGQDFGREQIEEVDVIELLKMFVLERQEGGGTFYLFYDKNQLIQADKLPNYIVDSDCKLTLYKNCRNTKNIASTSLRFLRNENVLKKLDKNVEGIQGKETEMYFYDSREQAINILNHVIDDLQQKEITDIQILTSDTEANSIIADECSDNFYYYKNTRFPFTTCRKFKGLEADTVIMLDIDNRLLEEDYRRVLYVGASRARIRLILISMINSDDCTDIIERIGVKKMRKPQKAIAVSLNAKYKELQNEIK